MSATIMLSHDAAVSLIETADIGATNATTSWVSMAGFDKIFAYAEIGTFNGTDVLDECKLQQAQSSGGLNVKDLTTSGAGLNYNTTNAVGSDGDTVILEARAEDLDVKNGFDHVRLFLEEDDDSGTDNVTGFLIRYDAKYKAAEKNGAAVAAETAYVSPDS